MKDNSLPQICADPRDPTFKRKEKFRANLRTRRKGSNE